MNINELVQSGIDYITDQYHDNDDKDTGWIEGWICGFTDPVGWNHPGINCNEVKDILFEHLQTLK